MSPKWKLIESNQVKPLSTLIFSGYKIEQTKKYSNSIYNTFKIWRRICKITKVKEEDIICLIERAWDPDFTPNGVYDIFKTWDGKCLTRFHKMYNEGGMVSFENLAKRYSLPSNNFYRYLQVRSYLREKVHIKTLGDLQPLLRYILKTYQSHNFNNTTGQIYQILQGKQN